MQAPFGEGEGRRKAERKLAERFDVHRRPAGSSHRGPVGWGGAEPRCACGVGSARACGGVPPEKLCGEEFLGFLRDVVLCKDFTFHGVIVKSIMDSG